MTALNIDMIEHVPVSNLHGLIMGHIYMSWHRPSTYLYVLKEVLHSLLNFFKLFVFTVNYNDIVNQDSK